MTGDIRHVAIVGAGGMGALFGAILAEGGLEVTLVDTDQDHIEAIRRDGLRISGLGGDRHRQMPSRMMPRVLNRPMSCWCNAKARRPARLRFR